jgi:branched-chain amino acid transport system permease protein
LPALRIKGLFLMITTFGLAVAVQSVLFDERYFKWLLPQSVERPSLFFLDFDDERSMYFLCIAALVAAIVVVGNLRRSRVGRILIALRENEANLQSFGVTAVRAKLLAFGIAGALAGFAGVVFAHQQRGVSIESFGADASIEVFTQAVIGGVSSAGGALLGSAYFTITEELLGNNVVIRSFVLAGGPLAVIFLAPGGLISLVNASRDSVLRIVAQRRRIVVPSLFADYDPDVLERQLIPLAEPDPSTGLAALPVDQRYALPSELYQGPGERIIDKLGPVKEDVDKVAITAAASSFAERETVGAGTETA